jgi:hypothetical protein
VQARSDGDRVLSGGAFRQSLFGSTQFNQAGFPSTLKLIRNQAVVGVDAIELTFSEPGFKAKAFNLLLTSSSEGGVGLLLRLTMLAASVSTKAPPFFARCAEPRSTITNSLRSEPFIRRFRNSMNASADDAFFDDCEPQAAA